MKVIFIDDVPKIGKTGETKEVANGYARNYLLPRKLAVLANSAASNIVESRLKAKAKREAQLEAELVELAKQIDGHEYQMKVKTGGKERLYGSITNEDIAIELSQATGKEIDKRKVELPEPVHQLGTYEVSVRLGKDIVPKVKITVIPEEETTEGASGETAAS